MQRGKRSRDGRLNRLDHRNPQRLRCGFFVRRHSGATKDDRSGAEFVHQPTPDRDDPGRRRRIVRRLIDRDIERQFAGEARTEPESLDVGEMPPDRIVAQCQYAELTAAGGRLP